MRGVLAVNAGRAVNGGGRPWLTACLRSGLGSTECYHPLVRTRSANRLPEDGDVRVVCLRSLGKLERANRSLVSDLARRGIFLQVET